MRIIGFVLALVFALILALLAVANRHLVEIALWPDLTGLGAPASPRLTLPLFAVVLLAGLIGFLLGAAREWVRERRLRRDRREARREAYQLRAKMGRIKAQHDDDDDIPGLPAR